MLTHHFMFIQVCIRLVRPRSYSSELVRPMFHDTNSCLSIPFVAYFHFAKEYPYLISEKIRVKENEILHFILVRLRKGSGDHDY